MIFLGKSVLLQSFKNIDEETARMQKGGHHQTYPPPTEFKMYLVLKESCVMNFPSSLVFKWVRQHP